MTKFIDLSGKRFGKLTVLHRIEVSNKHICYLCRCDCGKERIVQGNHLVEYHGETHTIAEWARITGLSENALYNRVNRGWDLERTFTQPIRGQKAL